MDVGVDCATQNSVDAAVRAHIDEAAAAPNVFQDYWSRFLLPLPQAGPEYPVANSVELGGKPSALPPGSVYRKRLKYPTPRQELSHPGREKPPLACPSNQSTKRVKEEGQTKGFCYRAQIR